MALGFPFWHYPGAPQAQSQSGGVLMATLGSMTLLGTVIVTPDDPYASSRIKVRRNALSYLVAHRNEWTIAVQRTEPRQIGVRMR